MGKRRTSRIIILLISIILIAGVLLTLVSLSLNRPANGIPSDGILFRIEKGEPLASIAERLENSRLIKSALFLKTLSKFRRTENSFKAGTYRIKNGSTATVVHDLLVSGKQTLLKVTIPEGWTIGKIAQMLDERGVLDKEEFVATANSAKMVNELGIPGESVEGYLFPDTYYFPEGYSPEAAIRTMVDHFFEVLESIQPDQAEWKRKILHENVILASIVEREYRIAEEAPYIASVFKNRLAYNIGLESCATVEYIISEIQGKEHPKVITLEDLKIDSLFNTYKWHGLPPGPISNAGKIALKAAFQTPATDFYYFVLKDPTTGEHYFSEDLKEHNRAKIYYLKAESQS